MKEHLVIEQIMFELNALFLVSRGFSCYTLFLRYLGSTLVRSQRSTLISLPDAGKTRKASKLFSPGFCGFERVGISIKGQGYSNEHSIKEQRLKRFEELYCVLLGFFIKRSISSQNTNQKYQNVQHV